MVRYSLALCALIGATALARAAIPTSAPTDHVSPPALNRSYSVFFEAGKARLTPEARDILQIAARQALAMPEAKVNVMIPTGASGGTALLQSRARSLKTELVRDGVKPGSIGNAEKPRDAGFANFDPQFRTWLDRSATVEIVPLPDADSDERVG